MLSGIMLIGCGVAVGYGEKGLWTFLACALFTCTCGYLMVYKGRHQFRLKNRQLFLLTTLSWLIICLFGSLPLYWLIPNCTFTDAWFEQWPLNMIVKTMSLDPSKGKNDKKADYQAVIKLGIDSSDTLYVQADMKRRPIGQMIADTVDIYRDWQPHAFGLECNSWQDLLAPDFAEEFTRQGVLAPEVWQINNTVNKQVRIRRLAGYLANGRMRFKKDCPGTKILVDQLIDFPSGSHDDGPDALEMAIRLAEQLCNGT